MLKSTFLPSDQDLAVTVFVDDKIAFLTVEKIVGWEVDSFQSKSGEEIPDPAPLLMSENKASYVIDKNYNIFDSCGEAVSLECSDLREAVDLVCGLIALKSGSLLYGDLDFVRCEIIGVSYEAPK